jgi:S1-C subfamily serine protease
MSGMALRSLRTGRAFAASILLLLGWLSVASSEEATAIGGPAAIQTLAPLVKKLARTEVAIKATVQTIEAYQATGPGSGFPDGPLPVTRDVSGAGAIVDAGRGLIVTGGHVVKGADTISVQLSDGRCFAARNVVADEEFDLAVVKIDAPGLIAGSIDSLNQAEPGDFVLALGGPLGLEHSATFGMISAVHRSRPGLPGHDLLQVDILLGRGSSGGPLFNLRGEIIGINIARIPDAANERGFGFAAPAYAVIGIISKAQQTD